MVANRSHAAALPIRGLEPDSAARVQRNLGLSDLEMARIVWPSPGRARNALDSSIPSELVSHQRLSQLEELDTRLQETFADENGRRWLRTENRYLGGRFPIDLLITGRFDRVHAALEALDSGVFI